MAQTMAEFRKFRRKGNIRKNYSIVYRMRNSEGWFWASFTDKYLLDSSEKELEGKLVLLCGKWEGLSEWEGRKITVDKSYPLLEGDFFIGLWEKKGKEVIPEKKLREVE